MTGSRRTARFLTTMSTHQSNPPSPPRSTFPGRHLRQTQLFAHPDFGQVGKHEHDQWTIHDAYQAGVADGHMEEAYDRGAVEPHPYLFRDIHTNKPVCDLHPGGCPTVLDTGFGPLEIVLNLPDFDPDTQHIINVEVCEHGKAYRHWLPPRAAHIFCEGPTPD